MRGGDHSGVRGEIVGDTNVAPVICTQDVRGETGVDERSVTVCYIAMKGEAELG